MNTVNMPEFKAEFSLYKTQECYRMTGNLNGLSRGGGRVLPQLRPVGGGEQIILCNSNGCRLCFLDIETGRIRGCV